MCNWTNSPAFALAKGHDSLLYSLTRKANTGHATRPLLRSIATGVAPLPERGSKRPVQLIAENLTVERGWRTVISELSFTAISGEALVLTGPNGSGKTTLLRTLGGFIRPLSGAIRLTGGSEDASIVEQCHFIGHANAVKNQLTVRENLDFWSAFLGAAVEARDQIDSSLARFHLTGLADYPAGYLSAGQKRRVGLARLLAARRPLWLLDEPTASLDTASAAILSSLVNSHLETGGLVIAATHLPLGITKARELNLERCGAC